MISSGREGGWQARSSSKIASSRATVQRRMDGRQGIDTEGMDRQTDLALLAS